MYVILSIILIFFILLLVCFRMAFYSPGNKRNPTIPNGEIYEKWKDVLLSYRREADSLPFRDVKVISHDGLTLRGKYYEYSPDAPIELMLHGYRGCAESDLSGGVLRSRRLGHSALIVNNRGSGTSDGRVITFGIKECLDVPIWVKYITDNINPNARIILTGISMGASTVMLASAMPLPKNVIGVLADCGYSSAEKIIKKVIADMKLPVAITYPLVRLSGRLFGGFDLKSADCVAALKKASVPVIFLHGDSDDFVPCDMSRECFEACDSRKKLVIIDGAGHGLAYPVAPEKYIEELKNFFKGEKI
ncbi:MAG: alpha/beta hydrolase [Clostridia bacterium]|nr:alpha/beta hydrolase [Clostridia bacterium]